MERQPFSFSTGTPVNSRTLFLDITASKIVDDLPVMDYTIIPGRFQTCAGPVMGSAGLRP